jgi:hypothetical protein
MRNLGNEVLWLFNSRKSTFVKAIKNIFINGSIYVYGDNEVVIPRFYAKSFLLSSCIVTLLFLLDLYTMDGFTYNFANN